jgi:iron-sulfur cluster assembly protein
MITRQMSVAEIFARFPHKAQRLSSILSGAGLECGGCHGPTSESLEAIALGSGFEESEIEELERQLNGSLEEPEPPRDAITLTSRAAAKYRAILDEEKKVGWGIRFEEQAGGCNGFEYLLDYSQKAREGDVVFVSEGVEIHVPKNIVNRLVGSEIDFVDGLRGSGFKVSNPNVKSCCGCGSSHGY